MRTIERIVVHTAGAGKTHAVDQKPQDVLSYWQRKGWKKPGYHVYVRFDGSKHRFADDSVETNGVLGFNKNTLHVCGSGNGDLQDFTPEQKDSIVDQIVEWLYKYMLVSTFKKNPMRVLGHRETRSLVLPIFRTNKSCPGAKVKMTEIRKLVIERLNWIENK